MNKDDVLDIMSGIFFIKYWRMERNTGGWKEILADDEEY
jgi:hypothetical protein